MVPVAIWHGELFCLSIAIVDSAYDCVKNLQQYRGQVYSVDDLHIDGVFGALLPIVEINPNIRNSAQLLPAVYVPQIYSYSILLKRMA